MYVVIILDICSFPLWYYKLWYKKTMAYVIGAFDFSLIICCHFWDYELNDPLGQVFLTYALQTLLTHFLTLDTWTLEEWYKTHVRLSPANRIPLPTDLTHSLADEVIGLTLGDKAILGEMSFLIHFECKNSSQNLSQVKGNV